MRGEGGNSGSGVGERRCEAQDSTCCIFTSGKIFAICLDWLVYWLAWTGGIRAAEGFNQEACWWGRVALREVEGCCCVIGHTFCHPSGTFQLSVATRTTVVGRLRVCPYRRSMHIHSCAQWHVSYSHNLQLSKNRSFSVLLQSHMPKLVLIWASLALSLIQSKCCLLPLKSGLIPHHSVSSQSLISCGSLCGSWHPAGSGLLWSVHWNQSISADQAISQNTQRLQQRQRNAP